LKTKNGNIGKAYRYTVSGKTIRGIYTFKEGLVQRKVVDTKPIQTLYSLTEQGATVGKELYTIKKMANKSKSTQHNFAPDS
jgi:hypothetical protein